MKQTYLSVVVPVPDTSDAAFESSLRECLRLDTVLQRTVRMHEVILVARSHSSAQRHAWDEFIRASSFSGPLSIVIVPDEGATHEMAMIEGLARSVGDAVLEWEAYPAELDIDRLNDILDLAEAGHDIVSVVPEHPRRRGRAFYSVVNRYRTVGRPLQVELGRLLSRASVEKIVESQNAVRHRKVIIAQSGLPATEYRSTLHAVADRSYSGRISEALDVALTATRLGTRMTYLLALVAAAGGVAAALYALFVALIRGGTPEGWVTLMVVVGLGFAATFMVLALLGEMMTRIMREVRSTSVMTVRVHVAPPSGPRSAAAAESADHDARA